MPVRVFTYNIMLPLPAVGAPTATGVFSLWCPTLLFFPFCLHVAAGLLVLSVQILACRADLQLYN